MGRGMGAAAALTAVFVSALAPPGPAPAASAAEVEPCVQTQGAIYADVLPGTTQDHGFGVAAADFPAGATLVDLDVGLGFDNYYGNAQVSLIHAGQQMLLMGQYSVVPSPQATYDLTYDDEAAAPLAPDSPSGGRYQPPQGAQYQPLKIFDGTPVGGLYTLRITNHTQGSDVVRVKRLRLVMTISTCDSDGDGVEEKADNCPTVANADQLDWDADGVGNACDPTPGTAPGPPGTCTSGCAYVRTVGLRHKEARHRLVGKVASVAAGCESGVPVTIWRKRSGADRKLVVVTTRATGAFRTKAPRRAGRYYAAVGSAAEPLCGHDTSRVVRIRRR